MSSWLILLASLAYLLVLFAVAYYGDKRAEVGRSLVANPYVYTLSIGVYCTSWTFYGSVGRAAETGVGFLPIYLGPTLAFAFGWFVLRKILRISKAQRITSIADFIGSRYGKSQLLGGLVTVIAVIGTVPYIALQLMAVANSIDVLLTDPQAASGAAPGGFFTDAALLVAVTMAVFSILFGTRHIEPTEHHSGLVVAIAFESVVKLLTFLAVGIFVTYGLFEGFGDIFGRIAARPDLAPLMTMEFASGNWLVLTLLAMAAIICLPRQFQVTVVENVDEKHLNKALWLFPLYLFAINIFVLPIAFGGLLWFGDAPVNADTFVLALPIAEEQHLLALLVFLGGLSAATAMVIVASVALSTMVCNDLVMPLLLRYGQGYLSGRANLTGLLLGIRRVAILLVLLFGYLYLRVIGNSYALVSIGLVSFAAVAQFAPAMLIGIFWRGGTKRGAIAGLSLGFGVWLYTLLIPFFARSGMLTESFINDGPLGIGLLKPFELFGLSGLDPISHSLFWSMTVNVGAYVLLSLLGRPSLIESNQATLFVEAFRQTDEADAGVRVWRGTAPVPELRRLAERYVGKERADRFFHAYARRRRLGPEAMIHGDQALIQDVERLIAGAIGAASARLTIATAVKGEDVTLDEVMAILDEATGVLEYSRQLERKSDQLEAATRELQAANQRLQELDRLKDEFLSTVSHELRTPLTSIRSFSEILQDDPDMPVEQRREFLGIVVTESERLTRLINNVLDMAKIEAGRMHWNIGEVDVRQAVDHAMASLKGLFEQNAKRLAVEGAAALPKVRADYDRLVQVVINLLSNAEKFCPAGDGLVKVALEDGGTGVTVSITDNGPGIPEAERESIFDRFYQVREDETGNPMGTGLGLAISRRIVEHLGGRIWVEESGPGGSCFRIHIPHVGAAAGS